MNIPRRDLLKFAAGGALGAVFTPVPWKVIDDIAIWSQNWSWIPKPPRGETAVRFTTCTLCPAGCAVQARCVGGQPVALAGVRGGLCPAGLAGHHLPYRPGRVKNVLYRGKKCGIDDAVAAIQKAVSAGGPVAVLDQRPGRTASLVYRRWLAGIAGGLYLTPVAREDATLRAVARVTGGGPLAFDLAAARAVVSFGAPLLDGWGTPASVLEARSNFKLVQVEPRMSRTAGMADVWLPAKPGTEAALAEALAGAMAAERAAEITGVSAEAIRGVVRLLAENEPAVAVGGGDSAGPLTREEERAVAALNIALGAPGRTIVARREATVPEGFEKLAPEAALEDVADGSIRVLIIDEGAAGSPMPWGWLKRKLAAGAVVASVAASREGYAKHADYVIPAPVYTESAQDVAAACDSRTAKFAVSAALLPAAADAIEPADFVTRVAGGGETLADVLKARAAAIGKALRGSVFTFADGNRVPVGEVADLWKALEGGAVWTDDETPQSAAKKATPEFPAFHAPVAEGFPLALMPSGWRAAAGPVSPLFSKLYAESRVRDGAGEVRMNPKTAAEHGVAEGGKVAVETRCGSAVMRASLDEGVMPGVLAAAVEPGTGVLEICNVKDRCGWRCTPARMRKA